VNGICSESFEVKMGVRQGCVLSPLLFNTFFDKCMREACEEMEGFQIGNESIKVLLYADDAVLLAENAENLQSMLDKLYERSEGMNLRINAAKTKVMVFERETEDAHGLFTINGEAIECVSEFVYLGRLFSKDGCIDKEIERRVNAGRKVLGGVKCLAKSETLSKKARLTIRSAILAPTLLYGSETWVCQKKHESKINAVDMCYLRSMCGKTRYDRVRNADVKRECEIKKDMKEMHESKLLRWFGHVERMSDERMTKKIYNGTIAGKKGKGRPRKTWVDEVDSVIRGKRVPSTMNKRRCMSRVMDLKEAKEVCKDRGKWRMIVNL
jgi:hypothetical protein